MNLYLHVVGRRADGYHLLDSLVAFADIGDEIEVMPADRLSLTVTGPFADRVPADAGNLALRAAEALGRAAGRVPGVAIRLAKHLPVSAGIGGGSADAAAVLRALCRLWQLDPAAPEVTAVAASLGADVPVCLAGRTAFVGGVGEHLDPAPDVSGVPLVLVNPGIGLATPDVFRACAGSFSSPARFDRPAADPARLATLLRARGNDLFPPAQRLVPEIGAVLAALEERPDCLLARMSGSGATCFGLFGSADSAGAAAAAIAAERPGWWVRTGHLL